MSTSHPPRAVAPGPFTASSTLRSLTRASVTWHRPLVVLAAAMVVTGVVSLIGLAVDPRELVGAPAWAKPLKFSLSIIIYAISLSWLIGQVDRFRRLAWWAGTVVTVALLIEMVVIVGAVLRGTTSHFNVSTALDTVLWSTMGVSIVVVWLATLLVAGVLFLSTIDDRARATAIRAGVLIALVGMGIAFFMTSPTSTQLQDFRGIAGAHTVGSADGGTGIPLLGWSTIGGDLRVPHFVGMHALQALPIAVVLLELASARVSPLENARTRGLIINVLAGLYAAVVVLLTVQALLGESIVRPSLPIAAGATTVFTVAAAAIAVVVVRAQRRLSV